jgi:hypothetical protein
MCSGDGDEFVDVFEFAGCGDDDGELASGGVVAGSELERGVASVGGELVVGVGDDASGVVEGFAFASYLDAVFVLVNRPVFCVGSLKGFPYAQASSFHRLSSGISASDWCSLSAARTSHAKPRAHVLARR